MEINVANTGMDYHAESSTGMELDIVFGPDKPAEDRSMNPVELFISALCMCIAAMLRKFCTEHELEAGEIKVWAETDWSPGDPMCPYLDIKFSVEGDFDERRKAAFVKVAETCPVGMTMAECEQVTIEAV
ncbi:MAG: OsmC family protein [Armatimonadota bacterium]